MSMHPAYTAVLALIVSSAAHAAGAQVSPPVTGPPQLETSGTGESRVAPDRATITLAVETKGASAAAVAAANARTQERVLDTLRALGLSGENVSTARYSVAPNYEGDPRGGRRQIGYIARNSVRVRLAQLDRIGAVIDAALARGANNVQGVEFEAMNPDAARQTALAQAAQRARADAEALARSMGGRLGPLLQMGTRGFDMPMSRSMMLEERALGGGTAITPSDIRIVVSVFARWQFVP